MPSSSGRGRSFEVIGSRYGGGGDCREGERPGSQLRDPSLWPSRTTYRHTGRYICVVRPAMIHPRANSMQYRIRARVAVRSLALLAVAVAGCSEAPKAPPAPPPPAVTVAHPVKRTIVDQDEYVGRFVAVQAVEVRARVSGYLESVHFVDGQIVKEGDLLFTIDKRPFQNTLDQARANLQVAKSNAAYHGVRPGARAATGARPDRDRADLRAAGPGEPQRAGVGPGERSPGAPGRARSGVHRAARADHRPHRRPACDARQPGDRRHRRQHHAARHHRVDRSDPLRVHLRRGLAAALRAAGTQRQGCDRTHRAKRGPAQD